MALVDVDVYVSMMKYLVWFHQKYELSEIEYIVTNRDKVKIRKTRCDYRIESFVVVRVCKRLFNSVSM